MRRVLLLSALALCFNASVKAQASKPALNAHATQPAAATPASRAAVQAARASFAKLPLSFEENVGQTDGRVKFTSRGAGYNLFLTADEAVFALRNGSTPSNCAGPARTHPDCADSSKNKREQSVLWLRMAGANSSAQILGSDLLPGRINYYTSKDPSKWRTGVRQFGRVIYQGIYPGVDLTYYGNEQQLESDFVVEPGASPRSIEYDVTGARAMHLDAKGNLVLVTAAGDVQLLPPGVYQTVKGVRRDISGRYVIRGSNRVGLEVASYDTQSPLVIDPVFVYSTYLGGSSAFEGDSANAIAVDPSGDAYVTGTGESSNFPGAALNGPVDEAFAFAFITKFDPNGNTLLYSTLLRGTTGFSDSGNGIAVDSTGKAFVDGITGDSDFPLLNPFQSTFGDVFSSDAGSGNFIQSGFVAGLAADGTLAYSTYFGGRNEDDSTTLNGIAIDTGDNAYIVGYTDSNNFPTVNPLQATLNGSENVVVAKFNNQGQPVYSTYLGGGGEDQGNAIAVDASGNAYVTGETSSNASFETGFPVQTAPAPFQSVNNGEFNVFVSKLTYASPTLSLENSTLLGGSGSDEAFGIDVDGATPPNVYITGQTTSGGVSVTTPFPTKNSLFAFAGNTDAFVTEFTGNLTTLVYSTFLGGGTTTASNIGYAIALDGANPPNVYVAGSTTSSLFPTLLPLQSALGGSMNAFVAKIGGVSGTTTPPTLDYSTFLGGRTDDQANGIAVDSLGNAYIAGGTSSSNFPVFATTGTPFQSQLGSSTGNAFVAKIGPGAAASSLNFFPPAFNFNGVGIGMTSQAEAVTLSNNSAASVTLNSFSFTGADASDFTVVTASSTCTTGLVLATTGAGSTCILTVTFTPQLQDARAATLSVGYNSTSTATTNFSGFGGVPDLSISPSTISFGTSLPLNVPAPADVFITNRGDGPAHIGNVEITGTDAAAYKITGTSGCALLAANGGECFIELQFLPTAAKTYNNATLQINDDAAGSPQSLPMTGTGAAHVTVSPTSLEFGGWLVGTMSGDSGYTLQNGSGGNITLSSIAATGNTLDFPIDLNNTTCINNLVLLPGVTCDVSLFFQPKAGSALDGRQATFTFTWTGTTPGSQAVTAMGTGETGVTLYQTTYNNFFGYVGGTERFADFDQIFNGTASSVTVNSIVLSGADPQDYLVVLDNSCSTNGVIPASSVCYLDGAFSPSAVGTRTVTATINYTINSTPTPTMGSLVLTASGTGNAGPVVFPGAFDFGTQIVSVLAPTQRVSLLNVGKSPLAISTVSAITGANAGDFAIAATSTCKSSTVVPTGGNCFFDLTFTPGGTGSRAASFTVTDNGPGSPRTLNLTGTGEAAAPSVSVSPNALDFGNVVLLTESGANPQPTVTAKFNVINAGNTQATISVPPALTTAGSPFGISSATTVTTCFNGAVLLPQGGTCTVAVTFTPTGTGPQSNSVTLTYKVGTVSTPVTVSITATAVDQAVLAFGVAPTFNQIANGGTTAAQLITLTNSGTGPATISSLYLTGSNSSAFAIVTGAQTTCAPGTTGVTLTAAPGPGNTCTVAVTFTAPKTVGTYTASVSVTGSLGNNTPGSASASITGNVVLGGLSASPNPIAFGTVAIGTSINFSSVNSNNPNNGNQVVITNNNIAPVTITSVAPQTAGDFTIAAGTTCSGALSNAQFENTCTFDVTFAPTLNGTEPANNIIVTYNTGGPSSQVLIPVTGAGVSALAASPNPLNISGAVGGFGGNPTVTIGNGSSSAVNIVSVSTITGAGFGLSFEFCTGQTLTASGTPGNTCQIYLTYNPTAPGTNSTSFNVTYTVGASPTQKVLMVTLTGTATAAQISLVPNATPGTPLIFPGQVINTQSLPLSILVTNTGNAVLNLSTLKITGTNSNDFALGPQNTNGSTSQYASILACSSFGFGNSIQPGQSCTIPLTFTPGPPPLTGGSPRMASLTITDNAYPSTTQVVVLEGNATGGVVTVQPTSINFPDTNVGSSVTQSVLLMNASSSPVTFTSVGFGTTSYSVDATQTLNACSTSKPLSAFTGSCAIYIKFTPKLGTNPDTATITTSGGSPTVTLTGNGISAVVNVSPTSLTFSPQTVGTASSPQTVTLSNPTNASVTVSGSAPTFTGTNASDFSIGTNNCTGKTLVATTGSCTVTVIFTPGASGGTGRSATLTISDTSPAASFPVTLNGMAIQPVASLSGTTMTFGSLDTGVTSGQQSVTLTNTGNASLIISSVVLGGTNAVDFAPATPSSGTDCRTVGTLAASSSCNVAATFTPTATGSLTATITITDNATPATQVITLSGTGTQPGVSFLPTSITFAGQLVKTMSTQSTTVLTNSGTGPLTINAGGVTITGTNLVDFALVTPSGVGVTNCVSASAVIVASGGTCTIAVTFTPGAAGARSASVSIADNASGSPQSVPLSGTGTAPAVSLNPTTTVSFGNEIDGVTSGQQTVTLTNTGTASLSISTVAVGGTNQADFAIVSGATCTNGAVIGFTAPNNTCTVALTFTPGAAGSRTGTLTFTDNSNGTAGSIQTLSLTGTGQTPPTATLSVPSVAFGNQLVGTTSTPATAVTITNSGTATLAIASIVLDGSGNPGDFVLTAGAMNPCPLTGGNVSGGASCTFNVAFKPTAANGRTATVDITDNGNATGTAGTKQTLGLTGTGTAPLAQVAGTLPFGNQPINQTSTMALVVTNNGTAPLTLAATNAVAITAGTNSTLFGIAGTTTCTNNLVIAANGTCTINVTFAPTAVGTFGPVTLVITDNSGAVAGTTQSVTLSGSGVTASVNLAPSPVNFTPSQNVGTTSGNVTVTLTNSGGLGVQLAAANAVVISGANGSDFAIVGTGTTCINSATVAASGGTCKVILTFTPGGTGARTATLTVTDNANPTTQTVTLNGTGIAPVVSLNPTTTVSFGNEIDGVTSGQQTVTLTNTGTASLSISTVAVGGTNQADFAIVSGATCTNGAVIGFTAPNNTCTVALTFTPGAAGSRTGTLTFTDNSNGTAGSIQTLSLTGTGQTPPTATLSVPSVAFGNQLVGTTSTPATAVTITNSGTATLAIASIVLDGSGNPGDFVLTAGAMNPCPLTGGNVSGGASCTFNVAFKPTAANGRTATVDITDNGNATGTAGTKQTLGLTGTGTAPLAQVAGTLPFGNQPINQTSTMALVVTNNGTAPLTLAATNAVAITAGTNSTLFGIAGTTTCTNNLVIAANGTCTINVTFAPTAVGTFGPVTLVITDNSGAVAGTTQSVTLSGSGVTASVNLAPSPVNFTPSQNVGTTSGNVTVTLTNSGGLGVQLAAANAVVISGANGSDFAIVGTGTTCINSATVTASGGTCKVILTFTPGGTGARTATLTVTDNANPTTQTVTLNGTGIAPAVSLSTSTVTFTNQIQLTTSAPQTITLTNTGTAALDISTVLLGGTNPGDFAIISGAGTTCPGATVGFTAPNNTCTVAVTFTPATANPFSATVTFTDNASPVTQVVNLSGTGVTPPIATPSPTSLTFSSQPTSTTSAAQTVTLTNSGGSPLSITSITLTGANPGDFAFASPATTCPTGASGGLLAAGTNCVLSVTFDPTAIGARAASIAIVVTGIANPAPVTLTGTGTAPDVAIVKSHVGSFEVGGNGTYTIKLTNNGTVATQHQITVTDTLPAGLTFVSSAPASWTCSAGAQNAQIVTCTNPGPINTGAANASTLTLTVSVAAAAFPSVTNSATVADAGDSGTNDKSSTDAATAITAPDVTISKSHTGDFAVGSNGTYTIKVTNNGTGQTTGNITVSDTLPTGFAFVSNTGPNWGTCSVGAQNAQVVTCTYTGAALAAAGGNSTLTITVSVAPNAISSSTAAGFTATNSVTVSDPNDSKTTDKSATDPTNIDNSVPAQSSFSPSAGLIVGTGVTSQQVTLTGTGFNSSTQVAFGSNPPLTGTANAGGTSLTITVPAGDLTTAGNVTISVTNPANPTTSHGGGPAPTTQSFPLVAVTAAQDASTAGTIAVTAGTPAMVKIDYTTNPANSPLPAALTVTCTVQMSLTGATCSVNGGSIAAGATTGSSTITINAIPTKSGNSGTTPSPWTGGRGPWSTYMLWLVAAALLSMLGMWGKVRQRTQPLQRAPAYLTLALLVLAAGALVGCTTAAGPTPTPTGPSSINVTATTADGATVTTTVMINVTN